LTGLRETKEFKKILEKAKTDKNFRDKTAKKFLAGTGANDFA